MKRLFIAVELPEAVRGRLRELRRELPDIRMASPDNAHLTLRFLGVLPEQDVPAIKAALRGVRAAPFSLRLRGLGLFSRSRQSVLWAGLAPCPALPDLKRHIDEALLRGAGLAPDTGRFAPHVTLSRLKAGVPPSLRAAVTRHAATVFGEFSVAAFILFSSALTPGGALHTVEEACALHAQPPCPART